jgi:hypothetical protein
MLLRGKEDANTALLQIPNAGTNKETSMMGLVSHTCNPSIGKAER